MIMKLKIYLGNLPQDLLGVNLIKMCNNLRYRIMEKNKDCFILILGYLGEGKSTLASELSFYMDRTFNEKRTIFRDYHYWRIKRSLMRGYDPIDKPDVAKCKGIQFDEIKHILLAKESMKPEVLEMEKDLNDVRSLGFFFTGCIDDIKSATRWIRENRVQIILYIPKIPNVWIYKLYQSESDSPSVRKYIEKLKKELLNGNFPYTPFKSSFKRINPKSPFWIAYSKRKSKYQIKTEESKAKEEEIKIQSGIEQLIKETMSRSQAARALRISTQTIDRLVKKKDLKSIMTIKGRRIFITSVFRVADRLYGREISLRVNKPKLEEEYE